MTGVVYGTKTLVRPADPSNTDAEQRTTPIFFVFGNRGDQIVATGARLPAEKP